LATSYLTPGVYVEEVPGGPKPIEGVGTAVAAFLGIAEKGPIGKATLVTNWTQYTDTFGGFIPGAYLAHAVYAYFNNGGSTAFVIRVGDEDAAELPPAVPEVTIGAKGSGTTTLRAIAKDASAPPVTIEVTDGPDDSFNLTIKSGANEEKYEGLNFARGPKNVFEATKASKLATLEEVRAPGLSIPERIPAAGTYALAVASTAAVATVPANPDQYAGNTADRTGLGGLEAIDQVTMVAAPDIMAAYQAGALDMDGVKAIQLAMIAHCERMGDRVAIIDTPPGLKAQDVLDWRSKTAGYDSNYAALYYPWVKVANPTPGASSTTMWMPPSAHLAGLWARNDNTRGVHKAPANEVLRGVIDIETNVTAAEQGLLNPIGINCIRSFPNRGIRVWGARTLSSDPEWRYLNVRRLFNYVEKSIENGTQWVVFEPNDYFLWRRVKRDVSNFLTTVWMQGALFGKTPDQAFFVKCDEENNPSMTRDLGQLYVDIGIAPVKPAEFVIFRIRQYTPGAE
jgi:phage tail sheath protein FI